MAVMLEHGDENDFSLSNHQCYVDGVLEGCTKIETVARESGFESIILIIMRRILVVFNEFNRKMGQNPLSHSRLSILGQPPSSHGLRGSSIKDAPTSRDAGASQTAFPRRSMAREIIFLSKTFSGSGQYISDDKSVQRQCM